MADSQTVTNELIAAIAKKAAAEKAADAAALAADTAKATATADRVEAANLFEQLCELLYDSSSVPDAPSVPGTGDSSLPDGDTVNSSLRWLTTTGWTPVPTTTTRWLGLTRAASFADMKEAVLHGLTNGTKTSIGYPARAGATKTPEDFSYNTGNSSIVLAHYTAVDYGLPASRDQITNVWPENGTSPFAWWAVPTWTQWSPHYKLRYRLGARGSETLNNVELASTNHIAFARFNGVSYDVRFADAGLPGGRPDADDPGTRLAAISIEWVTPVQPDPTVEEIT